MKDDKIQKPPSVTLLFVITKKYILLLTDDVAHKHFRSISCQIYVHVVQYIHNLQHTILKTQQLPTVDSKPAGVKNIENLTCWMNIVYVKKYFLHQQLLKKPNWKEVRGPGHVHLNFFLAYFQCFPHAITYCGKSVILYCTWLSCHS